ncbi:MAG: hypothetical protein VKL59_07435 [Nostocaceae cyanobacterium]|nr:hypothetical protein [Nostocaceae cyanobacterium]
MLIKTPWIAPCACWKVPAYIVKSPTVMLRWTVCQIAIASAL